MNKIDQTFKPFEFVTDLGVKLGFVPVRRWENKFGIQIFETLSCKFLDHKEVCRGVLLAGDIKAHSTEAQAAASVAKYVEKQKSMNQAATERLFARYPKV
jgi:hypothetical protein